MNPSTELVTLAFARRQGRAMSLEPGRATAGGLTQPEAACKWGSICKAVDALPKEAKAWAYFAYVDEGVKMDQAGAVVPLVLRCMDWTDPDSWREDSDRGWRKVAVVNYVVRDTYKRRGITSADLAAITQLPHQYFAGSRPWGRFKQAVDQCLDDWQHEVLTAVSYALDRRAA